MYEATVSAGEPELDVEDEHEEDGEEGQQEEKPISRHPLSWLFSKLSYQAKHAHIARRNKSSSSVRWFIRILHHVADQYCVGELVPSTNVGLTLVRSHGFILGGL